MWVKLTIPDVVEVPVVGDFRIALGTVFELKVSQARGPLRWSADNDEVLDITDDGTDIAVIKAANVGTSVLEIHPQVGAFHRKTITVFQEEAVGFDAEEGDEVPRG